MKWTLVTGGAKGLGKTLCLELAKKKEPVILHYNTSYQEACSVQKKCLEIGGQCRIVQGNFVTKQLTLEFIERVKKEGLFEIKALINNVGNYLVKSALKTSDDEWEDLFQINFHAPVMLIQAFFPTITAFSGRIINLGVSGLITKGTDTYSPAYTLTKQALLAVTRSFAKELADFGVTVNMVSPGHMENSVDLPKDVTKLPLKRAATCKEVSELICYLLSEKASYITGQNIEVAGGVRL